MANYSSISSTSDPESDCCATGSSSIALFWHVCNLHMSVHFRPLLRQVHLGSSHDRTHLNDVFRATVLAKLLYCASAWSGFCLAVESERLDTFIRRCKRLRYSGDDIPEVAEMFESNDRALFSRIIRNDKHVLQHYLPERYKLEYNLRPRQHNKQLLTKTTELNNRDYIVRMLYKDAYWNDTRTDNLL